MNYSKDDVIQFKEKGRCYDTWRVKLGEYSIWSHFFNNNKGNSLQDLFPGQNITRGMFRHKDCFYRTIRYVCDEDVYYIFKFHHSYQKFRHRPLYERDLSNILIGKVKNGVINLMYDEDDTMSFAQIPESYMLEPDNPHIIIPYSHMFSTGSGIEQSIRPEDIEILNVAYDGIKAFNKLIKSIQPGMIICCPTNI